jgi:hypothetical protein
VIRNCTDKEYFTLDYVAHSSLFENVTCVMLYRHCDRRLWTCLSGMLKDAEGGKHEGFPELWFISWVQPLTFGRPFANPAQFDSLWP